MAATTSIYELEGQLLEVCNCNVLCPCWIGEDPDRGTCDAVNTYHIERGTIEGVDVSGRTLSFLVHIPGNVLQGNWRVVALLDDGTTDQQMDAILGVFTGKKGGPLADLSKLVGEVLGVERVPINFAVKEGKGTLKIGGIVEAEMEPYRGPTGQTTTLNESIFSTIPGSPAWVSKASTYHRQGAKYGLADIELNGHNAIQGTFRFAA
jgi:hypothetical protein